MTGTHWLALFGGVLAMWALLFAMSVPAAETGGLWDAICRAGAGEAGFAGAVLMWALMSGAMMAPTALPAFATFDDLPGTDGRGFASLVGGYLLVWLGFALLAALLQVTLAGQGALSALGQSQSKWLTGGLFLLAGAYQFTALKEACLSRCRAPLTFFMAHWTDGPFRNGLRLGADCLGCCWALMLLAFVGGTMSLAFMGLAMVLMTLEKLPELGTHITKPLGVGLIGLGVLTLLI
jgi:predicted metal-binding membrane protein